MLREKCLICDCCLCSGSQTEGFALFCFERTLRHTLINRNVSFSLSTCLFFSGWGTCSYLSCHSSGCLTHNIRPGLPCYLKEWFQLVPVPTAINVPVSCACACCQRWLMPLSTYFKDAPRHGSFPSLIVRLSAGPGSCSERGWWRRRSELVPRGVRCVFRQTSACTNTLLTAFRSAFWAFKTKYFNAGSSQLLSSILLMPINCQHWFGRESKAGYLEI